MAIRFSPESEEVLRRAQVEASASGLLWPRAEHLLLALLADPQSAAALGALGADPARVAQQTRDYLASPAAGARPGRDAALHRRLWRWLFPPVPRDVALIQRRAAVHVLLSARSDITPLDLLVSLFRASDQRRPAPRTLDLGEDPYRRARTAVAHPMDALRQSGATTPALLRYVAHGETPGEPAEAPALAPDALVEVHILNDDYTTMEFVVTVLRDDFGLGERAALDLTQRVHHDGIGTLGTYRYGDVEPVRQRVEARAQRQGYPLKVTIVPVLDAPGG
jgi:ATP-dependent Clp protease adaptor protein ClpS